MDEKLVRVGWRVPKSLREEVSRVSAATGFKQEAAVMLALQIGLPVLLAKTKELTAGK